MKRNQLSVVAAIFVTFFYTTGHGQISDYEIVQLETNEAGQTITGFGASLAYYENWLTEHPNKSEIYDIIFSELSLDILRVRNAYGYDNGMINRVKEFATAAENSLGHPIDILVTSWSPPGYLKSNNDKSNGGTLKYTIEDEKVNFDYSGFAKWWDESLDNYNANGIFPTYISIQNEPDWAASYESCLMRPTEVVNRSDTIAGYNKALNAVYDTVMQRTEQPVFLGPETIGIGYNAVENYVNALDLTKLHGIAHHLYHGAEGGTVTDDPFTSSNYQKVGNFHPEVPHFQTEYSRAGWFSLAAMMYQSLAVENVTAFLYWDLIWDGSGLVDLHFPWNRSQWKNSKGYNRTKDFYVFKHYSAFIHPGWKRISTSLGNEQIKTTAFISASNDSAAFIAINRSETDTLKLRLQLPDFVIHEALSYSTHEDSDFVVADYLADTLLVLPPKSIHTVDLKIEKVNTGNTTQNSIAKSQRLDVSCFPNPFTESARLSFNVEKAANYSLKVFDTTGKKIFSQELGFYPAGNHSYLLSARDYKPGIYIYQLQDSYQNTGYGKMIISGNE